MFSVCYCTYSLIASGSAKGCFCFGCSQIDKDALDMQVNEKKKQEKDVKKEEDACGEF